jgi:hypothetical protein
MATTQYACLSILVILDLESVPGMGNYFHMAGRMGLVGEPGENNYCDKKKKEQIKRSNLDMTSYNLMF